MKSSKRFIANWRWLWTICAATTLAAIPSLAAAAGDMRCHVDRRTEAHLCYSAASVREAGGWRRAQVYRGGPDAVRATGHSIEVECSAGRMRLRDRDGVIYVDTIPPRDQPAAAIAGWLCAETLPGKPHKRG